MAEHQVGVSESRKDCEAVEPGTGESTAIKEQSRGV